MIYNITTEPEYVSLKQLHEAIDEDDVTTMISFCLKELWDQGIREAEDTYLHERVNKLKASHMMSYMVNEGYLDVAIDEDGDPHFKVTQLGMEKHEEWTNLADFGESLMMPEEDL